MQYRILTSSRSSGIGNGLTYEADEDLETGRTVRVPLRNRYIEGIVLGIHAKKAGEEFDIKRVKETIGNSPLLSGHQIKLLRWIADHYYCSLRQAIRVFLPARRWSDLFPEIIRGFRLTSASHDSIRGKKQIAVVEFLQGKEWVSVSELRESTGAGGSTVSSLKQKGIVEEELRTEDFARDQDSKIFRPSLTSQQKDVTNTIRDTKKPSLLFGVTGSGKTEVYAELIADTIERGKQAILLVPEILLTEHCIHRFEALMEKSRIAVIHSKLSDAKRRELWKDIRYGQIDLVIGSRSALFSPLENIGLVIIDEEHEWTYKNEQTPRYHARETAEELCRLTGSKLLLGSATPSLESWARAKSGLYHLAQLPERYNHQSLPKVRIVDLADVQFGNLYPFSPPLLEAIADRLQKGEQSVLFINRRGAGSAMLCLDCRRRVVSPDSQMPFTVHYNSQGQLYLHDHTTDLKVDAPNSCPHCSSHRLRVIGAGTQKVEAILRSQFPQAKILRADRDTLAHPEDMRTLLQEMKEGHADILLGTQSVVKGLDLPLVTLGAVLLADIGLSLPHFRAGERVFQLLTQLTGRSGRARPGEVIIQTFRPDAAEVKLAALHKTEEFLDAELKLRVHMHYPPSMKLIRLLIRGLDPKGRAKALQQAALSWSEKNDAGLSISSAPTLFGGGKIWHVLIRGMSPRDALSALDLSDVTVDIDPIETV